MIDHVSLAVRNLAASTDFYEKILAGLGLSKLVVREHTVGFGKRYPEFWINSRPDMRRDAPDSGFHICLRARTPEMVDNFHKAACSVGGQDDGKPGLRPQYSEHYYAAFIKDLDGNRIEAVTFIEPSEE